MTELALHLVAVTASTITLGWTPPPDTAGYYFYADGKRVSNSTNPNQTQVRFKKVPSGQYKVEALGINAEGTWPVVTPPPPPPPPPPADSPWLTADWTAGVAAPWIPQGPNATTPGHVSLTAGPGAWGPNQASYQTAVYINPQYAHAAPGDDTWYRVSILFPQDYKPTRGEWNWVVVWHVGTPQAGAFSCGLGVFSDGQVVDNNDPPGTNPRYFFVVRGGSINQIVEIRKDNVALKTGVEQTHDFHFDWQTYPAAGKFEWLIDGQKVWETTAPNMLDDGLPNGFGLYNYRRVGPFDSTITFGKIVVGPTLASVS